MSQLKKFGEYVGDDAGAVLEYAMNNWWKFAVEAKASAGLDTQPMDPDPGFLLKHCEVVVNLYLQSIAKPERIVTQPPKHVPVAYVGVAEDNKPWVPSPDELKAILAAL